jgi:hypothetical protein
MGQLRDRMDADLRLRGLSENTRRLYLRVSEIVALRTTDIDGAERRTGRAAEDVLGP